MPTPNPRAKDVFLEAVAVADPGERAALLDAACAGDAGLRIRVEALLDAHERPEGLLDRAAFAPAGGDPSFHPPAVAPSEGPGTRVGPYLLLEPLGEGGMGTVYLAEQSEPVRRRVALKVVKPGMDTAQVIGRFERERQALALMDHPNIARVLDAGATPAGRPYFVMERVEGVPITHYCDAARLSLRQRLELFLCVCRAIQHAHQKGIIHRDIKPTNVLVAEVDGSPVPKVIDFGVARAVDAGTTGRTVVTVAGTLVGTPEYMSPEQAGYRPDIDTRTDVYGLGVLLYELLTGTTPIEREDLHRTALDEVLRRVREEEPPRPSTRLGGAGDRIPAVAALRATDPARLARLVRGDLDWVAMKALEKDRARRYETAEGLARDLRRFLEGAPVEAGPPSRVYLIRKFVHRHRAGLAIAASFAALLIGAAAFSANEAWRARQAERTAERHLEEVRRREIALRRHRYASDIRQVDDLVRSGQGPRALKILEGYVPAPGEPDLRNFAWHYLMRLCHDERRTLRGHKGAVYHAEFAPDGRTLATCGLDGTVRFWEVGSGRCLRTLAAAQDEVNWLDFSKDGRSFATAGDDGVVKVWDTATCAERAAIAAHKGEAVYALFLPDGRRLVTAGRKDGVVKVWDLATRKELASMANDSVVESVAPSPDGTTLAVAGLGGFVRLWKSSGSDPRRDLPWFRDAPIYGVAFSSDGRRLAVGGTGVRTVDLSDGRTSDATPQDGHHPAIQSVAFLPGDRTIVSAGEDGTLRLWDAETRHSLGVLLGHSDKIWGVTVSPDGATLATASSDGTAKLWDARPPRHDMALLRVDKDTGAAHDLAFTPDGRTLVVARAAGKVEYRSTYFLANAVRAAFGFDVRSGAQRFRHLLERVPEQSHSLMLTTDGAVAVFRSMDGLVTSWRTATGERLATFAHRDTPALRFLIPGQAGTVATYGAGHAIELVDAATGRARLVLKGTEIQPRPLAFSPKRNSLVGEDIPARLVAWDFAGPGRMTASAPGFRAGPAVFSDDGAVVAVACDDDGVIRLRDAADLRSLGELSGHPRAANCLAFSPDGATLASGGSDGALRLWDVAACEELITLRWPSASVERVRFSPDGRSLAYSVGGRDGLTGVYLITTERPE